ncbi:bifunctional DNA-formamidopyrimidine glycosylase/DNA-(apurinic or apyrimidinic site) lyase [Hyphococcus formosus]|uniref:bifunctional DNA-formamidopyrimidine glycosylase/DNA-(apurinic or apyrimidinic site) lyase n=1 Tax=Hyphococcus formosus TaxID=3143534 RepID=UPI00398B5E40
MPELPEVETVRRGLAPVMEGAVITAVEARRPDLRFPFPSDFAKRLKGVQIERLERRGKYLMGHLSSEECLIMHLGMSGRFTIDEYHEQKSRRNQPTGALAETGNPKHDHVVFELKSARPARVVYNDPRRFGFMDIVPAAEIDSCKHFALMGPEPLSNYFSAASLNDALSGRSSPIKAALLDQRNVAGLGNIYVCEALYRARVSPRRRAGSVAGKRGERLYGAIIDVLRDAIEAGGSTLRDFAAADGALGYFQHRFDVYDREGEPCRNCKSPIQRIVQSGRSTFFCGQCQR